jgi:arylsulfatase
MRTRVIRIVLGMALAVSGVVGCGAPPPEQTATPAPGTTELDRTVLPIAEPKPPTYTELDARNAKPPARFEVKAPSARPMW